MRKVARTLAALLLLGAVIAAASHGHLGGTDGGEPCATCVFAGASGATSIQPTLPAPVAVAAALAPSLVVAPGFTPPPLSLAPKVGPPAA
jgi:hypothetical protein